MFNDTVASIMDIYCHETSAVSPARPTNKMAVSLVIVHCKFTFSAEAPVGMVCINANIHTYDP